MGRKVTIYMFGLMIYTTCVYLILSFSEEKRRKEKKREEGRRRGKKGKNRGGFYLVASLEVSSCYIVVGITCHVSMFA